MADYRSTEAKQIDGVDLKNLKADMMDSHGSSFVDRITRVSEMSFLVVTVDGRFGRAHLPPLQLTASQRLAHM